MHLQELFAKSARIERDDTSRSPFGCRMQEGISVWTHKLKMIEYIEHLEALGFNMDNDLYIDLLLHSLPESCSGFIVKVNLNNLDRLLPDLVNMLRVAEKDLKKSKVASLVLLVNKTKKRRGKARNTKAST